VKRWPLLLLGLALAAPLLAQTFYGSIVGTVTDDSGAIVPEASVTLSNLGTSERRELSTDALGNYQFVNLVPGRYRLDVAKTGFRRLTRDEILVEVQNTVRFDVSLTVGDVGQVVEVKAETPLLQTESSALGQVVESRAVQQMPLNGRNVLNLVALVPGVVPQGQSMGNPTNTNISAWGNYQIGGGIGNQSAAYLDGGPLNTSYNNAIQLVPTQDAIQEFRVQTNNVGAEFGRFGGGVVNLTSKSGTNDWHGSAYEFLRNKVLNANTFFNNRAGVATPAFTQNQFGANAGGPILKDRTFFFFSYEGFRLRQGQSNLRSVPTVEQRNGDFSNTRNAQGSLITIYDPLTPCGVLGNAVCATGQTILRQPFPDNKIPVSRFDKTAQILEKLWALPNSPGQGFTNLNNFIINSSVGGNNDQYNFRIDQNLRSKQRIFGRFTRWTDFNLPNDVFQTKTGTDVNFHTHQFVLADTYTFTPSTVGDLRFAFFRFSYNSLPQSTGADLTTFGWPATLNSQVTVPQVPYPCVQNFSYFCQEVTGITANNVYSLAPSLTKIAGRHTLKIGAEIRRLQFNFGKSNQASGVFNFDNVFTSANPFSPGSTGYGWASYLLGYGATGQIPGVTGSPNGVQTFSRTAAQMFYQGYYLSDTFQATGKLTLNVGVRWDIASPYTERYDRQSVLLPYAVSPLAAVTGLPVKGKLAVVNSQDHPDRGSQDTHWKLFAPRVGFAYRLTNKTVIRAGFGIFFLPNDATFNLSPHQHPINQLLTPWTTTLDGGLTPQATFNNPFPNGVLQPPGHNASFQQTLYGQSVSSPIATQGYPYNQQWNFNIGRELPGGIALEVAYAGARGVHLLVAGQTLNQLPDRYLSLGTQLTTQVANPFYGLITTGSLSGPTIPYGQLLLPYPQYTGYSIIAASNRDSTYHSMQVKMEKRLRGGGTVLASYSFSKIIGNAETLTGWLDATGTTQDNNNLRLERSLSGTDVPHRLVVSYVQDLPLGKGRALFGNVTGVADKLMSGWGLNGVSTFQSGFPLGFTTNTNLTNSFGGGSRPNVLGGCNKSFDGSAQSTLNQWFNTSCFTQPAAFAFGNESRLDPTLRAHGIANWDFAMFKNTAITERFRLELRTEFFNLFNRVQFGPPGLAQGNPSFGVVSSQANNPRLLQFALRLNY
jgi:hypothetical protein